MTRSRGYSTSYTVSYLEANSADGRAGLVGQVSYPDGKARHLAYDENDLVSRFVDVDGAVWTRQPNSNNWQSDSGATWFGTVDVVQPGTPEAVIGTIIRREQDGSFLSREEVYFPTGIAVTSGFSRDRTEVKRKVLLLNGKQHTVQREGRHSIWYGSDGRPVSDVPDNVFQYGEPWRHAGVASLLSAS